MSVSMMDTSSYNLEQAVSLFYRSEAAQQANAHQWLTQAQRSPEAWAFVWDLLQPSKSTEVQFFAATTLHMKLLKYWNEVPKDKYMELKGKIFEVIYKFASGPALVLNRLCIALSAFVLHMMPLDWPNALSELINILQSTPFTNMPQDRILWIQLEVLTSIPEELPSVIVSCPQPSQLRVELNNNYCLVLNIVEQYLTAGTERFSEFDLTTLQKAARCAGSWFKMVNVPLDKCSTIVSSLLQIVHLCYWNRQEKDGCLSGDEHELSESALEAIQLLLTRHEVQMYPQLVLQYLSMCLQVLQKITAAEFYVENLNEDIVVNIYGLLIDIAETNSRMIIRTLCEESNEKQQVCINLLSEIMNCSNRPGIYPTQESCSQLAFGFWYMIEDEVMYLDREPRTKCMVLVRPVYCELVKILVKKSTYPPESVLQSWPAEDKEMFRCYRQDISDTMVYCYSLLTEELLYILMTYLRESISVIGPESWRDIEAVIYGFAAVAGHVHNAENLYIPELLQLLCRIPYERLDNKVILTALNTIGSYSDWMNCHPDTLSFVIPLLCDALEKGTSITSQATLALKEVTRECQSHLSPYVQHLLQAFQNSLQSGMLPELECARVMFCVGKVLVLLPMENIMECLTHILTPSMQTLQSISKAPQLTNPLQAGLNLHLKMISVLFSSLKYSDEKLVELKRSQNVTQYQPIYLILQTLMPTLKDICKLSGNDIEIVQKVHVVLLNAVLALMDDVQPMLKDICLLIVETFQVEPIGSALDVAKQVILAFHRDIHLKPLIDELFTQLVFITLSACSSVSETDLSQKSDLIESFFLFMSQICKKCTPVLLNPSLNLTDIVNLALRGITLPEHGAMKGCVSFLVQLVNKGPENSQFNLVLVTQGQFMITKLLMCLGGAIPRTHTDTFCDIFLTLNKKYPELTSKWLEQNLSLPDFPTRHLAQEQKLMFCKNITREKCNKRKMIEILRGFTFLCRGLVYTEYANQLTPASYY